MKEKMKELKKEFKKGLKKELKKKFKMAMESFAKVKNRTIYNINKKICDILYRRVTYIPEKGVWVSTIIFPKCIIFSDGDDKAVVCGVTDVFKGNEKKVEYSMPIYSEYIANRLDAKAIHRSVVEDMKTGYIAILG